MRNYLYRDHSACTMPRRREIREPVQLDLNERPQPMTQVEMPIMPNMEVDESFNSMYGMATAMYANRMVFETVRFTTMVWVEEHTEGMSSCGHYHMINSYFQVPQGMNLPDVNVHPEHQPYHDEDTEPYRGLSGEGYYRVRMLELERQVEELTRTRAVLPQEEIRDIGIALEQGRDKPVPFEHFDDENIFRVE